MPWQKGKMLRLLLVHLPGGVGYKTNIGTFTVSWGHPRRAGEGRGCGPQSWPGPIMACPHAQVAAEVLEELCGRMGITEPEEVQEFALFLIQGEGESSPGGRTPGCIQGGSPAGSTFAPPGRGSSYTGAGRGRGERGLGSREGADRAPGAGELVRPLRPQEYLNNVLVNPESSLHSRRLGWETRLHFDNPTYISTHYSQVSCCPLPGRGLRASLPSPPDGGRTVGGCRAQLPLTVLCPQVQRDYLQGKLLVGAQADAQVARLAALQLVSRTQEAAPSE